MTDPHWPNIHVTQLVRREGRTFHEVLSSPVCDFCGHDSPAWDYDCQDFPTPDPDLASFGGWAACTPCSDMIEAEDWDGVLERCLFVPRSISPELERRVRGSASLMHAGFRQHRYGERRPWG